MALIDTILSQIINAKYGRDVRQAIHDGIQQCYTDAIVGEKGDQGISITSVQRTSGNGAEGTTDVYTVYFSDGTSSTFQVRHGSKGSTGDTGAKGDKGDPGLSIQSIVRTSGTGAEGTVDTYTITLTNGATQNFSIRNGSKGSTGATGATGPKGDPGVSITNIVRTSGTGEEGTTDIYTIYLSSGASQTFTVKHGSRGPTGATGVGIRDVRKISGTGAEGTVDTYAVMLSDGENKNFDVRHGSKGSTGSKGDPGKGVVGINKVSGTGAPGTVDTYAISYTDGTVTNFNVYNGADGAGSPTAQKLANARALTIGAVSKLFDGTEDVTWSLEELDLAQRLHTHNTSQITDFPTEMPASDVYEWAKAQTKPTYTPTEVGAASEFHQHTTSDITNFPSSMPASDVEAWAKALTKPSYTPEEVGAAPVLHNHNYSTLQDIPETFTPSLHTHDTSQITDFDNHGHGNIENDGTIGSDSDRILVTGMGGSITTKTPAQVNALVGVSNPNILHNWDWRNNPVNQRGVSGTITSSGYFYDRWFAYSANALTINPGYVACAKNIEQRIEGLGLAGKVATFSMMVDNVVYAKTLTFPSTTGTVTSSANMPTTIVFAHDTTDMRVRINGLSTGLNYQAFKLELGTVSTLHLDPPMDYGIELTKCLRYFWANNESNLYSTDIMWTGYINLASHGYIQATFPLPMKEMRIISPTLSGVSAVWAFYNGAVASGMTVMDGYMYNGVYRIKLGDLPAEFVQRTTYSGRLVADGMITLSADL